MSSSVERLAYMPGVWGAMGVVLLVLVVATKIGSQADPLLGGPHYFGTAEITSARRIPIIPKGRLSGIEAKRRKDYGIAFFDASGRLASYEAVKNGRRVWISKLSYSASGPLESETYEGPKGGIVLWKYASDGRFIDRQMLKAPSD